MLLRWRRILHPNPKHRLAHDPRIDAFEPVVPPTQALLKEADLRTGLGEMRVFVRPWPDQPFFRTGQILEQPEHRIRIAIRPAANCIDGTLDGAPVFADRTVAVEGVTIADAATTPRPRTRFSRGVPSTSPASARRPGPDREGPCSGRTSSNPRKACRGGGSRP